MTNKLALDIQISDPDDFYVSLIETHHGLTDEESRILNARLILILANQIKDIDVLSEALCLARDSMPSRG